MTRYDDFKPRDDARRERFATLGDLFKRRYEKPADPPTPEPDEPKETP